MLENQFIRWYDTIEPECNCEKALPIVTDGRPLLCFFHNPTRTARHVSFMLMTANGEMLSFASTFIPSSEFVQLKLFDAIGRGGYLQDISEFVAPNECFRVCVSYEQNEIYYSNLLRRIDPEEADGLSYVKYKCDGDALGFPFESALTFDGFVSAWLPINKKNRQFAQSEKVYEKSNGERVVLFSQLTREYECETDYIDEDMHEKIVVLLACDHIFVEGEKLTKSDNYDINWENYTFTDCGEKLTRATWKMSANVSQRNTNC